tara:strand:+ start:1083 stop:1430 length:348 start_codon:yes stop_codon:yes gene_type:complete
MSDTKKSHEVLAEKRLETEQAFPPPEKGAYGMPQYEKYTENPPHQAYEDFIKQFSDGVWPMRFGEQDPHPGESEEVRHERQKKYYDMLVRASEAARPPAPLKKREPPKDPSKLLS